MIRLEHHKDGKTWHLLLGWNDPDSMEGGELRANWRLISIGKTIDQALTNANDLSSEHIHDYRIGAFAYLPGRDA